MGDMTFDAQAFQRLISVACCR